MNDPIASWHLVAGAAHAAETRYVPFDDFNDGRRSGWNVYIDRVLEPQRQWGVRRFFLRNPFGTRKGADGADLVEFTQYDQAYATTSHARWLTFQLDDLQRWIDKNGCEVCMYIGNPDDDPAITNLIGTEQAEAIMRNVTPFVRAHCSIALDAASPKTTDSLSYALAEFLRRSGVKVYIESRPSVGSNWYMYPIIAHSDWWHDSETLPGYVRNSYLSGEVVVLPPHKADYSWDARGWERVWALGEITSGHTVALPMGRVLELQRFDPDRAFTRKGLGQ